MDFLSLKNIAVEAVKNGFDTILNRKTGLTNIISDIERDLKISADLELDKFLVDYLRNRSDFSVLSEEGGFIASKSGSDEYAWIIDPLDGSVNFHNNIPFCCISVGLWKGDEPVIGVVYDFNRSEIFTGIVGVGAWLNDSKISVSDIDRKSKSILCTGFPVSFDFNSKNLQNFIENIKKFKKIRLLGSAALSLCYVASGRSNAYIENNIKLWDVAAGLAIVKSAGGFVNYEKTIKTNILNVMAGGKPFMD